MITILIRSRQLRRRIARISTTLLVAGLLLSACAQPGSDDGDILVVATTSIWGEVVSEVVGDQATVEVLIPVGADAHDYQPTSRQIATLQEADLVVANGLGLEAGLTDVLENAAADGASVLELAPELDPIPFADHDENDHEGEEDPGHDHGDLDPHVWFDPERVGVAAGLIADRIATIDTSTDWAARARGYQQRLLVADEEIVRTLEAIPSEDRKLVTNHESLGYFADRYGFEVIAVVIPGGSTLGEPSSAELAALVEEMEHEGVDTIFAETTQPSRLADAVASELGGEVDVVEIYTESLGESGSGADTLIGMLVTNAGTIAGALQ